MAQRPQVRTAELLQKGLGSDNVCSGYFAVGEVSVTSPERNCRGCGQAFRSTDGRRRFCSDQCRRDVTAAALRRRQTQYRTNHPDREYARQTLKNAILLGKMRRCTRCEDCGEKAFTEGHHSDYRKPFFVTWLCRVCHAKLDGGQHFGCGGHARTIRTAGGVR